MSTVIERAFLSARRAVESHDWEDDRYTRASGDVDAGFNAVAGSSSYINSLGGGRGTQTPLHHAHQYAYNREAVQAVIRPVFTRVAGQQVRVARVLPVNRQARPERRPPELSVKSLDMLPARVKEFHTAGRLEILSDHIIMRALDKPNPISMSSSLWSVTSASMDITGKAHWWLDWNDEDPSIPEIYYLPSHWISPVHKPTLFHRWRLRLPGAAKARYLDRPEVAPFWIPDPSDPTGAYSPVQGQATTIETDFALTASQRMSLQNGANPGMAVVVGKPGEFAGVGGDRMTLDSDARVQIMDWFNKMYKGYLRDGNPIILDSIIQDVKRITNTPREMDYLASAEIVRRRLTQAYGVNPIVMGEIEGANRASSAVADEHFIANVAGPRCKLISEVCTRYLPPFFAPGENLVVWLDPPVSHDAELEHQKRMDKFDRGIDSRNDIRRAEGQTPLRDGESAYIRGEVSGTGWVPVVTVDQPESAGTLPPAPEHSGGDPDDANDDGNDGGDTGLTGGRAAKKVGRRPHRPFGTWSYRKASENIWNRVHVKAERELRRAVRKYFAAKIRAGEESIRSVAGTMHPPSARVVSETAISHGTWVDGLTRAATGPIKRAVVAGAAAEWALSVRTTTRSAGGARIPPRVEQMALAAAEKLVAGTRFESTVRWIATRIRQAVKVARESGLVGPALADAVVRDTRRAASEAADNLSETEANASVNAGQDESRRAAIALGKTVSAVVWRTRRDNRVRETHQRCNGQKATSDGWFTVGGYRCLYPADPSLPARERCRCRCYLVTQYDGAEPEPVNP